MKNDVKIFECGATKNGGIESDVIATLDGTTLTISGKGAMKNYANWVHESEATDPFTERASPGYISASFQEEIFCMTYCYPIPTPWDKELITKVHIQEGVTHIGSCAFKDCYGLDAVTIPNGVTSIGTGAFLNCKELSSIEIPKSVERIYELAFSGCDNLRIVVVDFPHYKQCVLADNAFQNTHKIKLYVPMPASVVYFKHAPSWKKFDPIVNREQEDEQQKEIERTQ
jgi:hypothetical protein